VPISLRELDVLALTGPPRRMRALARAIVCELAAFHAPHDLRVVAAGPSGARAAWRWMQWLPHARDPTPATAPATGTGPGDRRPVGGESGGTRPHVVTILDMTEPPAAGPSPDPTVMPGAAAGVTVIWLARTVAGEPSELSMRIRLDHQGSATLQETAPGGRIVTGIRADAVSGRSGSLAR